MPEQERPRGSSAKGIHPDAVESHLGFARVIVCGLSIRHLRIGLECRESGHRIVKRRNHRADHGGDATRRTTRRRPPTGTSLDSVPGQED